MDDNKRAKQYMRDTFIYMMVVSFIVITLQVGTLISYMSAFNKLENKMQTLESKVEHLETSSQISLLRL